MVVFDVKRDKLWERAVGVTRVPPRGGEPQLQHWHVLNRCRLDRAALEAAVLTFAPHVPVVDGPPLRRPRPYGVEAFALVEWQRLRSRP